MVLCSAAEIFSGCLCQVKKAAVDIVQGLTGSEEGLKSLSNHSNTLLASLLNLLGDKKVIIHCAFMINFFSTVS